MAQVMPMRTAAETGLARLFETVSPNLPGDPAARAEAFRDFSDVGLPHRRVEAFKYTDLRAAMREAAPFAPAPDAATATAVLDGAAGFAGIAAARLSFVNGHLVREASDLSALPAGVTVTPLGKALAAGDPALANLNPVQQTRENVVYRLNSAFMADGAVIRVAAGARVPTPLHLRFVGTGSDAFATATRFLVMVEEGASIEILETHEGPDGVAYQPNDVMDVVIGDRATFRHARLNGEGRDALALSTLAVRLGAESRLETVNVVAGATLSRHQVYLGFQGESATAQVNGVAMIGAGRHADSTLLADHAAPGCESRELFKTVIDGEAVGVFQGKIIVQPHAQKTDGRMMSACVLLSDGGQMMNKPELEIFADDVQCAHGATCGALDDDLLFYLMARGIPRPEAENLMLSSFLGEAVEVVRNEAAREQLEGVIESWLQARR